MEILQRLDIDNKNDSANISGPDLLFSFAEKLTRKKERKKKNCSSLSRGTENVNGVRERYQFGGVT